MIPINSFRVVIQNLNRGVGKWPQRHCRGFAQQSIHPTAVVSPSSNIHPSAKIGPYCVIGSNVTIHAGCNIHSHVCVVGDTLLEHDCEVYPFSVIGSDPQDKKYIKGSKSTTRIGKHTVIREHCTINGGTPAHGGETIIHSGSWILKGSHVGHDCEVGHNVVLSDCVHLAGHVKVGDGAIIGGLSGVRQFVQLGKLAMIGACSAVDRHVPPFTTVSGNRASVVGLNITGLRRAGYCREDISTFKRFARLYFDDERLSLDSSTGTDNALTNEFLRFVKLQQQTRIGLSTY